jgi:hypothetical protein
MRRTSKLVLALLFAVTLWLDGCAVQPDGEAALTENSTTSSSVSTTATAETSAVTTSTETAESSSTAEAPDLLPHEQAAVLACEALDAVVPVAIPHGETPYLESGFRMGNDFPYRFEMDSTSEEIAWWDGDAPCYDVHAPEEPPEDGEWWFADNDWRDEDGEIRIYMATADIDSVAYYGSNETSSDVPGAPETSAIEFDVSGLCPELPRIWIPDVNGHPENAGRMCMHHTNPIAEAVFVRVP